MSGSSLKVALILSLAFNAAVVGGVVYGFAHRPEPGEGPPPGPGAEFIGGRCGRLCQSIGVPRERMVEFTHAMAVSSGGMGETRRHLQQARGELIELLRAPQPDERAIMAKVDEISSVQGELEKALVQRLLKASNVLLPEERERLMHVIGCRGVPCGRMDRRGPGAEGPGPEGVSR